MTRDRIRLRTGITGSSRLRSAADSFQPSSDVKTSGASGTSVHCSGTTSDEIEIATVGVALDIEFEPRTPRPHQLGETEHIGAADMPLIGPRMRRQPIRAGVVRDP